MDMTSLVVILFLISTSSLSATPHDLLSCDTASHTEEEASSSSYVCDSNLKKCNTFAVLRANSLSSYHLGLEPVPQGQLQLIPIDCRCNGRIYEAHVFKTCVKGDTFHSISQSLQGLTTCLYVSPYLLTEMFFNSVCLFIKIPGVDSH